MIASRFEARLAALDVAEPLAEPVADRVAFLSGQSSYRHSQLSPTQHELLAAVTELGYSPLLAGFPFHRATLAEPWRREPILPASGRNTAQFLAAAWRSSFRAQVARHLGPLFSRTSRRLVLLCGSSGLALLEAAWPRLELAPGLTVLAIGLGPVARRVPSHPRLTLVTIQGRGDWISRLGFAFPPNFRVAGGHLDYAASAEVRALVTRLAAEFRS
ncbi:MAG: hypothetical protein SF066_01905 [Thermoanaerobaculia bacterium]|nr:hypothetical protein [Thermoanaerobaculia bacterium]